MKILFLVPDLKKPGGVANYYNAIRSSLPGNVHYFIRGTRKNASMLKNAFTFVTDYLRLLMTVRHYEVVLINTSFARSGIIRDALFCLICRMYRKPYIIFFRGWDRQFQQKISGAFLNKLFRSTFLCASKILVLSSSFADFIRGCGYHRKIVVETTIVDDKLFIGLDIESLVQAREKTVPKLLFLSRLEKNKGILECIEIHKRLNALGFKNELLVAGSGGAEALLKDDGDTGIIKMGYVSGTSKIDAYRAAHFYLFPSTHGEGMPNSVLEAMMFGLPIITTRVGGIRDFFCDSMGISTETPDVNVYLEYIVRVLKKQIDVHQVAVNNHRYALEHFSQDVVAERLLKAIYEVV